ncbi:FecR family protein [Tardiphaga sp.]|uniref:FecR family protein n=1 Tax=Tardiphaga sp. TaxID=1926292 RepID=UPI0037D9F853
MPRPIDDDEHLAREAHRWVALLVSGEASTADADALRVWRRTSPAHEQAFAHARRRWKDYGQAGATLRDTGQLPPWTPPRPMLNRRALLGGSAAAAACAAGYVVAKPPFGLWPSLSELAADYRTGTGEQRRITLAGDVSVRLNTQTSLTIADKAADELKLIAGEAAFAMPAGARRSLAVIAGDGRSTATTGRFEVRNVGASVCVTCVDGEVRVDHAGDAAVLTSGKQLRYDARGLQSASAADLNVSTAWQDGMLVFRLTPLADVVAEINRYRPGKVVLMSDELGSSPVNGRFRIQRIEEVLVWIEQAFNIKTRALPGGIVLLG